MRAGGRHFDPRILTGVVKRDYFHGGEVLMGGRKRRYQVPRRAVRDGIAYVTEDRKLDGFFETMSITKNIHMGLMAVGRSRAAVVSGKEMREAAEHWSATAVVISSYLPDILSLSDRILVARQGRVVEEFTATEAAEERIMYAAVH